MKTRHTSQHVVSTFVTMTPTVVLGAILLFLLFNPLHIDAQSVSRQVAPRPTFEVATVKAETAAGPISLGPRRSGDRVSVSNSTLALLVQYAYQVRPAQISGQRLPSTFYTIEAKANVTATDDQIRLMLQALLEERFRLKLHRESKEASVYVLTISKNGSKLKAVGSTDSGPTTVDGKALRDGVNNYGGIAMPRLIGHHASIAQLTDVLSRQLDRPVVDKTGLTGTFDFELTWTPDDSAPDTATGPSVFTALREQLGLQVGTEKSTVESLVIDHFEAPSEN
jgi:uncharacterized protein (TIGR03435 family)